MAAVHATSDTEAGQHRDRGGRFALFANVALAAPLEAEGEMLPQGAAGTVVEVLAAGSAYVVEFFEPRHCVVTVHDPMLVSSHA